jgi:GT2 family glycosyltransferase
MLEQLKSSQGYFDKSYFMYLEDLDLGWRARLAGWQSMFVPDAVVYHVWHGSSHRHGNDWLMTMSRTNRLRTVLKNASGTMLLKNSWNLLRDSVALAYKGGAKGPAKVLAVYRESLRGRRQVASLARCTRRSVEERWLRARA